MERSSSWKREKRFLTLKNSNQKFRETHHFAKIFSKESITILQIKEQKTFDYRKSHEDVSTESSTHAYCSLDSNITPKRQYKKIHRNREHLSSKWNRMFTET